MRSGLLNVLIAMAQKRRLPKRNIALSVYCVRAIVCFTVFLPCEAGSDKSLYLLMSEYKAELRICNICSLLLRRKTCLYFACIGLGTAAGNERLMDTGLDRYFLEQNRVESAAKSAEAPFGSVAVPLRDPGAEPYGLNWPGKAAMKRSLAAPASGVLRADRRASRGFERGGNLIIEGDNLPVLKRLAGAYDGQVKMIYIDPPYNSGRAYLYSDNFRDACDAGEPGWRHAGWLNMMYPRLVLARRLLREDGVLFVSIDDNEAHTLRLVLDEIFGEENFLAMFPWQSRTSRQNDTDLCTQHEYVLAYARQRRQSHRRLKAGNADIWHQVPGFAFRPRPVRSDRYANPDDDPRGPWKADPFDAPNLRPRLTYPITNPNTGQRFLPPTGRCWRMGPERYRELLEDDRIVFGRNGRAKPQLKVFYAEKRAFGEVATSWLDGATYGTANAGTRELQQLFDGVAPFLFPKPVSLLRFLLQLSTGPEDLVMDFFAGSGVTGAATLAQNQEDGGRRRFILVQRPEPVDNAHWPTLAHLTRERLRREIDGFGYDAGFRALRLDDTGSAASVWTRMAAEGIPLHLPLERVAPGPLYRLRHEGATWLLCPARRLAENIVEQCEEQGGQGLLCLEQACGDLAQRAVLATELAALGMVLRTL